MRHCRLRQRKPPRLENGRLQSECFPKSYFSGVGGYPCCGCGDWGCDGEGVTGRHVKPLSLFLYNSLTKEFHALSNKSCRGIFKLNFFEAF